MADVDLPVCRVEGAPPAVGHQQALSWVCNTLAGGYGWEKPGDGGFNWPMGARRKKSISRYPLTHASSGTPHTDLPGSGFESAWREGAAAWSKPGELQVIEQHQQNRFSQLPHLPQHRSSDVYLAQLDGLAWHTSSIIIQTGILKATWNAHDCARVRWQFAGWSPALQWAGQQATSGDGGSPQAGKGCACVPAPLLASHCCSLGFSCLHWRTACGKAGFLNSFL